MMFPIGSGGLATTGYWLAALRAANILGNPNLGTLLKKISEAVLQPH